MRQIDAIKTAEDIIRRYPEIHRHARLGADWCEIESAKLAEVIAAGLLALSYLETVEYHTSIHPSTVAQDSLVDSLRAIGAKV